MLEAAGILERRTTTDVVFDKLREDIVSLKLLPGTKLSEAEVARVFGVSRQPVRDAFSRLANLGLLLIRPQKATEVRGFSAESIAHARFVRLAVELEVVRCACAVWDEHKAEFLNRNLDQQQEAIDSGRPDSFHLLDLEFHRLICELGDCSMSIQTIEECKQKVDRLCMLSLGKEHETAILLEDHRRLADALENRSADDATGIIRKHLGRLDDTISDIQSEHSEYFE